jgi:hypothetical protein
VLAAIGDDTPDEPLGATARGLASRGVRQLPAIRIRRRLLAGERRLPEAAAITPPRRSTRLSRPRAERSGPAGAKRHNVVSSPRHTLAVTDPIDRAVRAISRVVAGADP